MTLALTQESFGYPKQMHATYSVTKDHNYGINQTPTKTLVHRSGSDPTVTGRVEVVDGEFTSSERQTTDNKNATVNNPNGCFQNRLGAVCQGTTTGRTWSYQERTKHINLLELTAVKLAILTLTKG